MSPANGEAIAALPPSPADAEDGDTWWHMSLWRLMQQAGRESALEQPPARGSDANAEHELLRAMRILDGDPEPMGPPAPAPSSRP